jgi:hypothetical protein
MREPEKAQTSLLESIKDLEADKCSILLVFIIINTQYVNTVI